MQAVILAAGQSSRFWPFNNRHKSLFKIMGRPLIWHTIENLKKSGIKDIIIVQSQQGNIEKELGSSAGIKYVIQPEPIGTGDAVFRAKEMINGPFVVIGGHKADSGDYLPELLSKFQGKIVLLGTKTIHPWEFGILKFNGGKPVEIVENPKQGEEPSDIKTSETYVLPKEFFDYYARVPRKEDSLIGAINLLIKEKGADLVLAEKSPISLKYPWDVLAILKTMDFKDYVAPTASIGKNAVINGKVYIGENCRIGDNNVLRGPLILEDNVVTGAFCEIKNSAVGSGTHFHSGYVGDSVIGENCRFGAGFITANRRTDRNNIKSAVKNEKIDTGLTHLGAIIGSNSRFGIHAGTMPGIIIGSDCSIGPGTLVFENVADGSTFYTKFEKVVKK